MYFAPFAPDFRIDGSEAAFTPSGFSRSLANACGRLAGRVADDTGARYDSASTLTAARDLEQVLTEVLRDSFGPRYGARYVPVGTYGVQPWMTTYIQKRITRRGLLDYVTSAEMPWIDCEMQEIPRKIHTLGGKIGWSWFDVMRSRASGTPLENEKAIAAREAAEETRDLLLISGDSGLLSGGGLISTGLINDASVPVTGVVTGNWTAPATADQVIGDVRSWLATYRTQSRRALEPNRLLLPEAEFAFVELTRVGDTGYTIKQYLEVNIPGLKIDVLPQLAGAGAGATDRAILYAQEDRVIRGVLPQMFSFMSPQEFDLMITVCGVERIAGVEVRMPFGMLYADGI